MLQFLSRAGGSLLFLCLLLLNAGCLQSRNASSDSDLSVSTPQRTATPIPTVLTLDPDQQRKADLKLERVTLRPFHHVLETTGVLMMDPDLKSDVTTSVSARIQNLSARVGDLVQVGAPLALLQSKEIGEARLRYRDAQLRLNLAEKELLRRTQLAVLGDPTQRPLEEGNEARIESQAALAKAKADLFVVQQRRSRAQTLEKAGIISVQQLEETEGDFKSAKATLEQAKQRSSLNVRRVTREQSLNRSGTRVQQEVQSAQGEIERLRLEVEQARQALFLYRVGSGDQPLIVSSPRRGLVVARPVNSGQTVPADAVLFCVQDVSHLLARIDVKETDLSKFQPGMPVSIKTPAYPTKEFPAKLLYLLPELDSITRTARAVARVENPRQRLKADMFISASIQLVSHSQEVLVPSEAVLHSEDQDFVYVQIAPTQFKQCPVILGAKDLQGRREIHSGLFPGQKVVVQGAFMLQSQEHKGDLKGDDD